MTQPTPYTRQYSFTNSFAASPTQVFPGASLDLELNSVKATADQILQNLKFLQNDDGTVKNGSIGAAQLAVSLQTGFLPPTVWVGGAAYLASPASTVFTNNKFYSCIVSHTSGTFATDLAAGKWSLIADLTGIPLQTANNIAITPSGGVIATNVQTAIYGLDTRITSNTNALTGFVAANVTDSTTIGRALMTAASADAALLAMNAWSTGDVKLTAKTVADTGWLLMADQTFGSATSGATYANLNAQSLYLLLWANYSNTWVPVTGGRGVSAAADWAANKPMALMKALGRALGLAGAGSGLTSRTLGQTLGEETHTLTTGEAPTGLHSLTDNQHLHATFSSTSVRNDAANIAVLSANPSAANNTQPASANIVLNDLAGGGAHNNMQPTSFAFNAMIKL